MKNVDLSRQKKLMELENIFPQIRYLKISDYTINYCYASFLGRGKIVENLSFQSNVLDFFGYSEAALSMTTREKELAKEFVSALYNKQAEIITEKLLEERKKKNQIKIGSKNVISLYVNGNKKELELDISKSESLKVASIFSEVIGSRNVKVIKLSNNSEKRRVAINLSFLSVRAAQKFSEEISGKFGVEKPLSVDYIRYNDVISAYLNGKNGVWKELDKLRNQITNIESHTLKSKNSSFFKTIGNAMVLDDNFAIYSISRAFQVKHKEELAKKENAELNKLLHKIDKQNMPSSDNNFIEPNKILKYSYPELKSNPKRSFKK